MVISHKHKFIFFKTRKTAGSSIQVSLAKHCGKNDIITGQYRLGIDDDSHSAGLNMDRFYTIHPHPELEPTKQFLGPEIWNSYFKFAFVRNPYDIAVSRYHWNLKGKDKIQNTSIENFQKWVEDNNMSHEDKLHRYTHDKGKLDLDFIGYYETLDDDIEYICKKIGIPLINLPQLKGGFRDKTHYSKFYNKKTKQLVSNFYNNDINYFNYNFDKNFEVKNSKPIIQSNMLPNKDGNNINGPSLIKVPDWVENALGKYYLYFSHHNGKYIRMAYSDNIEGPYTVHLEGTLKLEDTPGKDHIASPDVHIDNDKQEIIMYYHTLYNDGQYTFKAVSKDGLKFISENDNLGLFYFRVFNYLGETYAIAKNKNIDSIIYKKTNGKFIPQFNLIDKVRHTAVHVDGDMLYIFHTVVGEAPESLYVCKIKNWEIIDNYKIREPKYNWEGANQPKYNSRFGMALGFVNELRDPCIFKDNNDLYLLYSYGGESGIALSKLKN